MWEVEEEVGGKKMQMKVRKKITKQERRRSGKGRLAGKREKGRKIYNERRKKERRKGRREEVEQREN